MVAIFILAGLAGLAPPVTAVAMMVWLKVVHGDPLAGSLAGAVAIGLLAGVAMGATVGLGLLGAVTLALRASGR